MSDEDVCDHPVSELIILDCSFSRDIKPKTVFEQSNGYTSENPKDYYIQQYHVGKMNYMIVAKCAMCGEQVILKGELDAKKAN